MSEEKLVAALGTLRGYFRSVMPEGRLPRAIFHGAEPLMNRRMCAACSLVSDGSASMRT